MTLALHGKSRKRQFALLTTGLLITLLSVVAAMGVTQLAQADTADPTTISVDSVVVNPVTGAITLTVSGNWLWSGTPTCYVGEGTRQRWVGWAVAWGEPGYTDHELNESDALGPFYMGTTADNAVHLPNNFPALGAAFPPASATNCQPGNGTPNPTGSWGPLSHTYASTAVLPTSICVVTYDVQIDPINDTWEFRDTDHGDHAGFPAGNDDNSIQDPSGDIATCGSVTIALAAIHVTKVHSEAAATSFTYDVKEGAASVVPSATISHGETNDHVVLLDGTADVFSVVEDAVTGITTTYSVHTSQNDCSGTISGSSATTAKLASEDEVWVCILNTPSAPPTGDPFMNKTAGPYDTETGTATWDITVNNQGGPDFDTTGIEVHIEDEGATVVGMVGGFCTQISVIPAEGIDCEIEAESTLVITVTRIVAQTCEPGTATNTAIVTLNGRDQIEREVGALSQALEAGEQLPGATTADVDIPGDPRLCDSTVTVTKRYDFNENGVIDAADAFVPGWGMTLACSGGINEAGSTAGNGSIVFTVPGPGLGDDRTCTVTEVTLPLVNVVGARLDGVGFLADATSVDFNLVGDDSVTVEFLNDPGDQPPPTPTPPGGTPPPGVTTPEVPTPEPTEPVVVETPAPETPQPDTPEPVVESTPIAPDAGGGLAPTSGGGMALGLILLAAALMTFGAAAGALGLTRKHE